MTAWAKSRLRSPVRKGLGSRFCPPYGETTKNFLTRLPALTERLGIAHQPYALVQLVCVGVERRPGQRRTAVDIGPTFLLDGFTHTRQGLGSVPRVAAGSVNQILVPIYSRQADIRR